MDHPIKAALAALAPIIDMHAHPPYGPGGIESMLEAAWRTGIRRILFACLGSSAMTPYPSFDEVQHGNEEVYGLVAKYPGFVFGYVYVNPTLPAALDILEDGLARPGILGIKLWISCRDADGRLDPVYPVLERASEQRAPVLIHSFYRSGGNLPGELNPGDIMHLAARYPEARIIMAHLGGEWREGVRTVAPFPNVWADISGTRPYLGSVERAVEFLGASRVLYGSDAYFRKFSVMLAKVAAAQLSAAQKRRIVWDNAAELFFDERRTR